MSTPSSTEPARPGRVLWLSPDDNIVAAATALEPGDVVSVADRSVTVLERIPTGHKMALLPIPPGGKVFKYGAPIGSATQPIEPGQYVHTHNLQSDYLPTFTLDGKNPYLPRDGHGSTDR